MRRITASAFVSLDGVMQAPGGPEEDTTGGFPFGGWTAPYWDELTGESVNSLHERPFELLLGRKTYDIFAAHWPERDEDPIGAKYNRAAKHVVTTTEAPLSWANSRAIGDIDGVERLKESEGADLLIWGSSTLYPPLLRRGLIDRLLLMVFPVVLGPGKRLFGPTPRREPSSWWRARYRAQAFSSPATSRMARFWSALSPLKSSARSSLLGRTGRGKSARRGSRRSSHWRCRRLRTSSEVRNASPSPSAHGQAWPSAWCPRRRAGGRARSRRR